jgi:hypothetical protein
MLPQNLSSYKKFSFQSKGFSSQVSLCLPIKEQGEIELITGIVAKLNENAGLDLAVDFSTDQLGQEEEDESSSSVFGPPQRIVVVRGRHSSHFSDEFDEDLYQLMDLSEPGWRVTEENVDVKAKELRDELVGCDKQSTTVVFQLMDNSSYWFRRADGR